MTWTMRHPLRRGALLLASALLAGACSANPPAAAAQAEARAAFAPRTFTVQRSGSGRPVIFLPGLASSGAVWDSIVAELPGTEAHVLTLAGFAGVPAAGNRPMLESVAGEPRRRSRTSPASCAAPWTTRAASRRRWRRSWTSYARTWASRRRASASGCAWNGK